MVAFSYAIFNSENFNRNLFLVIVFQLLRVPMSTEIIMVILYLGCLLSGANWVLLSDITRYLQSFILEILG